MSDVDWVMFAMWFVMGSVQGIAVAVDLRLQTLKGRGGHG